MRTMTGQCLCGQAHYSAEAEPIMTAVCHCRDCQRQAGTAFTVVVAVPRPSLSVHGRLKTFDGVGASGKPAHRHFCPECGSPIFSEIDVMPDVAFIKAGTLDDTSWLQPSLELWCETEQPWVSLGGERPRYERMPA